MSDRGLPKFACLCPTYRRPKLLANAIAGFERLDYPSDRCCLVILDDAGQYPTQPTGPNWRLISVGTRFGTLGEKRNALAELAPSDADAFVVFDDDDVYLPWTLRAHAWALAQSELSCPSRVLAEYASETLIMEPGEGRFHSSWAFTRKLFDRCGQYPAMNSGEDAELLNRFRRAGVTPCNAVEVWPPWLIYRWGRTGSYHISAMGRDGYDRIGKDPAEPILRFESEPLKDWEEKALEFFGWDSIIFKSEDDLLRSWKAAKSALEQQMRTRLNWPS